jgi:ketosteroid isomerase-like protein
MVKTAFPVLFLAIFTVLALPGNPRTTTQDEQQLRQIEVATAKGEQQNDVSMMSFFADDWVASGSNHVLSKQQAADNVKSNFVAHGNAPNPYTIEKKNMQVYLFGDIAVVTYSKEYRQTPDTSQFFDEDDTDVFKRSAKGWLVQFSKISPASKTPAG